jgi:hypothetical protein
LALGASSGLSLSRFTNLTITHCNPPGTVVLFAGNVLGPALNDVEQLLKALEDVKSVCDASTMQQSWDCT